MNSYYLLQDISTPFSLSIATFCAIIYLAHIISLEFLLGTSPFFNQLEILTSISGWHSFRSDFFGIPILHTRLLNSPDGVNIAFTNSIPLAALLFKPFSQWLPARFHYFGCWFALSYICQAISSSLLIRSMGQKTVCAAIAAGLVSVTMPSLLSQTTNIALNMQAYLLCGLTLYVYSVRCIGSFQTITHYFTLLLILSLLTHPYLFIVTTVLYLSSIGVMSLKFPKYRTDCLITFGKAVAIIATILILGGYLSDAWQHLYNSNAIELNFFFMDTELVKQTLNHSAPCCRSFTGLGIGVIMSCLMTLFFHRRKLTVLIYSHRVLLTVLTTLIICAITHQLSNTQHTPLKPISFVNIVISHHYLFWPCGYALMSLGLVGIFNIKNKLLSTFFILLILAIQLYDTAPLRQQLYQTIYQPLPNTKILDRLLETISTIHIYPAYGCSRDINTEDIIFWQSLAARNNVRVNTAYSGYHHTNCLTKHQAFTKPISQHQLYIVTKNATQLPHYIKKAINQGWCRKTNKGLICIRDTDYGWWKDRFPNNSYSVTDC